MRENIEKLRRLIKDRNCDAALISSANTIAYLTGFYGFSPVERDALLLVTKRNSHLITSPLYSAETKSLKDITTHTKTHSQTITDLLKSIYQDEQIETVGFEPTSLTVTEYTTFKKLSVTYHSLDLRSLRVSKSRGEIKKIREATTFAHQALEKIKKLLTTKITEKELANQLELQMKLLKVNPSFPTIVAFGKNAAVPHHVPGKTLLKENDSILIDFGVLYDGYCSDTTRTIFKGTVPKKWHEIYKVVEKSQQIAVDFINRQLSSGKKVRASDADNAARDFIIKSGYPAIPHALGHGIGLEVHEAPNISPQSKDVLNEGMVFSIEPGVYIPGKMGVRIEDLFAIQRNKLIRLT